jgi:hypothetical protein
MRRIFILFILIIPIFFSCAGNKGVNSNANNTSSLSLQNQYKTGYWVTRSSDNGLTVIGISNPMIRRQDEIKAAKEDAARKVAMYFGIHGRIETISNTGGNIYEYTTTSNAELAYDTNYEKYIDNLIFDEKSDILITSEAEFVCFQYNASVMRINYNGGFTGNRPDWINNRNLPEIDGYLTSVGMARNQRRLKDTVFKATEDAVIRMIQDLSSRINTKEVSVAGQGSSSYIREVSRGSLIDFQVLEFWVEPDTRYVYVLAIARASR